MSQGTQERIEHHIKDKFVSSGSVKVQEIHKKFWKLFFKKHFPQSLISFLHCLPWIHRVFDSNWQDLSHIQSEESGNCTNALFLFVPFWILCSLSNRSFAVLSTRSVFYLKLCSHSNTNTPCDSKSMRCSNVCDLNRNKLIRFIHMISLLRWWWVPWIF